MRRSHMTRALLVLALWVLPAAADEEVDLLIAYVLDALEAPQVACSEPVRPELEGMRLVCGEYEGSFSQMKSDWELIQRHTKIPIPISVDDPWTFRYGAYRATYTHSGDRELHVSLDMNADRLQFAYMEQELDPYAGALDRPLDQGDRDTPRLAGFGGVSEPKLIEESRVEPLRSVRARAERVMGLVTLEVVVEKDGTVRRAVALAAKPEGYDFEGAAVEAVRQWKFEPAMFEGAPVVSLVNLVVEVKQDAPLPDEE